VRPKKPQRAQIEGKTASNAATAGQKVLLEDGLSHVVKVGKLWAT